MTDTRAATPTAPDTAPPSLFARVIGVIFSPRETFTAVAARPRSLQVVALVTVVMAVAQFTFLSTDLGKELALDQQVRSMESFGVTVSDEMYAQMETRIETARYFSAGSLLVFVPLINAVIAGLVLVIFTMLLGGSATFKHVYAIVSHAGVIPLLQQLFGLPLTYASGQLAGANLGVFVPMLEETSFVALFLGAIDLILVWWCITLAIGVGVLYRRKTGPIATGFISLYVLIALVLALVRS